MAEIIVVDDDEIARVWLRAVLERDGHQVRFATDGEAALKMYEKDPADVVITDLAMPVLNGLRLIRELIEAHPTARIFAISRVSKEQLDLAEDYGAQATFSKPFYPQDLLRAVTRALEEANEGLWW